MTRRLALGLALLLTLGLAACGDTNVFEGVASESGYQADLEKGIAALDDQDWDEAIRIFEAMERTEEVRKYLASAFMGKAGFDVLALVDDIAAFQETGGDASTLYDAATRLFGAGGAVSSAALEEARTDVGTSLGVLQGAGGTFQAGVYAAVDMVTIVGSVVGGADVTVEGIRGQTEEELAAAVAENYTGAVATDLARDAVLVAEAVADLSGNDVAADLEQFLADIGYSDDQQISAEELTAYLAGL